MKVTYFKQSDNGCDYYRAVLPMTACKQAGAFEEVNERTPVNIAIDSRENESKLLHDMNADVILLPRLMSQTFIHDIKKKIAQTKSDVKIVVDFDDNVFSVSPLSRHYEDYGLENVSIKLPGGDVKEMWKDGFNIDLKANQKRLDAVKYCLENVDMVTTTTEILANVLRNYNENVRILPNCINPARWQKLPLKETDEIRLFWSGGWSHYEDWFIIRDVIPTIMKKYKNVKFCLMGFDFFAKVNDLPRERFEFFDWEHIEAFPLQCSIINPDISLIPLKDTPFNQCKSAIKWIEMGAMGVPSVVSFVSPYMEMGPLSEKDNTVFIQNNDKDAWIEGISMLIENPDLRKEIGQNAKETVMKNFDIRTQYGKWASAYEEVLTWQRQATPL